MWYKFWPISNVTEALVMYFLFVVNNTTVNETITDSESNSNMNETATDSSDPEETTAAGTTAAPDVDVTTATVSLLCGHKLKY